MALTPEQWEQVKDLFDRALEAPPEVRIALLDSQSTGDAAVLSEVQRLLSQYDRAGSFLEDPPSARLRHLADFSAPLFLPGDFIASRYKILRYLGAGGMGEVYEAEDTELSDTVALKTVRIDRISDPNSHRRLRKEALLARRVTHPNVCRIFDVARHRLPNGQEAILLTMEFLAGPTLAHWIKQHAPASPAQILPILRQIAAGLSAAHAAAVTHRDFKPGNVILANTKDPNSPRVAVTDFGLALSHTAPSDYSQTHTGQLLGTLEYMSPEQLRGQPATPRSDIYSLGVTLFEMTTGRRPTQGASGIDEVLKRFLEPPPSPQSLQPNLPTHWDLAIRDCLNPDPARRPQSAAELLDRLDRPTILSRIPRPHKSTRRNLIYSAAALSLSYGGYRYWDQEQRPAASRGVGIVFAGLSGPAEFAPLDIQMRKSLTQSAWFSVYDARYLAEARKRMAIPETAQLTARNWRELALRENRPFLAFASVVPVGEGYALSIRAEQVLGSPDQPWKTWQQSFQAPTRAELLQSVEAASRWLRDLLGESAHEIASSSASPQNLTTPSWDALSEFQKAESLIAANEREQALVHLDAALRFDPDFTMAWVRKGDISIALARSEEGYAAWQKAEETSRRRPLSRREELRFRTMFLSDTFDYARAEKLYKEYSQLFPFEDYGYFHRSTALQTLGHFDEALAELKKLLPFPERARAMHMHSVYAAVSKSDYTLAATHSRQLRDLNADDWAFDAELSSLYVQGRTEEAINAGIAGIAIASPQRATQMRLLVADVLADAGRTQQAISYLQSALAQDANAGLRARQALDLISLAALHLDLHRPDAAIQALSQALALDPGPQNLARSAELYCQTGQLHLAHPLLAAVPDLPYPVYIVGRARIQAAIASAEARHPEAIHAARQAASNDLFAYGKPYLAHALHAAGQPREALDEYVAATRVKLYQFRRSSPEPAGIWRRTTRKAIAIAESLGDSRLASLQSSLLQVQA